MTTSDSSSARAAGRHSSAVRTVVIVAIGASVVFGLFLGYLAWTNDSFPTQTKPFSSYANVTWDAFNGTELAFRVQWVNASAIPIKAQVTSPATDAANTPVCEVGLSSVKSGQTIFMPFTISPSSATLSQVSLNIDVQPIAGGSDFTIIFNLGTISAPASSLLITPSSVTCQQPLGSE